jgi:hypothetical protein
MAESTYDLLSRIGQLEHRVRSIRLALAETALRDDVRRVLLEHLDLAEQALALAREEASAA